MVLPSLVRSSSIRRLNVAVKQAEAFVASVFI